MTNQFFFVKANVLLLLSLALTSGCVSSSAYWADRGRDLGDIATLTVGAGVGVKARVGLLQTGLLYNRDVYGLKNGSVHHYRLRTSDDHCDSPESLEFVFLIAGGGGSNAPGSISEERMKHDAFFMLGPLCLPLVLVDEDQRPVLPHLTQIEVVVGLGPSIRFGINPGELLDFLLGFFGLDIYNDDLGKRRKCPTAPALDVVQDPARSAVKE